MISFDKLPGSFADGSDRSLADGRLRGWMGGGGGRAPAS